MPSLESRANALGPWFHKLWLGADATVQTAPDHPLGDFADFCETIVRRYRNGCAANERCTA